MTEATQNPSRVKPARMVPESRGAATRTLTMEVAITFSARVANPDHHILEAVVDGLLGLDEQGLLFPGLDWPALDERLLDVTAEIKGVGRRVHDPRLAAIRDRRPAPAAAAAKAVSPRASNKEKLASQLADVERDLETKSRAVHGALGRIWRVQEALVSACPEADNTGYFTEAVLVASEALKFAMQVLGKALPET